MKTIQTFFGTEPITSIPFAIFDDKEDYNRNNISRDNAREAPDAVNMSRNTIETNYATDSSTSLPFFNSSPSFIKS